MEKRLVNPDEMAKILGVSKRQIYALSKDEKIPRVKVGQLVRFDPEEVIKHFSRPAKGEE